MGGSGGGSGHYPSSRRDVEDLRNEVLKDLHNQERVAGVNEVLAENLASFNDRNVELVQERLEQIEDVLGDLSVDMDRLLFGGSVAKHTYVDGLSDVDALVVVDAPDASPSDLVHQFRQALERRLGMAEVAEVSEGRLAVTVKYRDGSEIQLLPAVERDGRTSIASSDGNSWRHIKPHKFAEKLTQVNKENGRAVVPTIKLAKALLQRQLTQTQQLGGYHIEAIAVDAFRSYDGRRDRRSMLIHLVRHAADAVHKPTGDITKQSVHIDEHLGAANSQQRRSLGAAIARIASRLETGSADNYRQMLNE